MVPKYSTQSINQFIHGAPSFSGMYSKPIVFNPAWLDIVNDGKSNDLKRTRQTGKKQYDNVILFFSRLSGPFQVDIITYYLSPETDANNQLSSIRENIAKPDLT